ncbi:hypothetical protein BST81_09190 [Leptolyngbya sp. 'hensonii']|uniref:DUF4351 domain-containing protein n=1 Tax=Leptolyngbya sp. 'hensonii' TaxID=1922337 RepID=UPI00094FFC13|nr:DUF4351 domain-containing protein [Leptolyngbya sp. 'hensonii']OLP18687.1 hypothetical protein BST81_09190 [Leptolyngbya sp. 'hensonii']
MTVPTDQDSPWKEILRHYFPEAIAFFFPSLHPLIDWQQPVEFLDKEFQQIAPDSETGKRYADLLVKVWRNNGPALFLLLHVEVQAQPEANFPERMFVYALRIFDRFRHPAVSLAILCDRRTDWRPERYEFTYPLTHLCFEFGMVKLLDYQTRWPELEASQNPFATVVMAHLKAQETKRNATARQQWKLSLIRRLYEAGYDRREVLNLFKFIDWVMILPEGLKQGFWLELKAYEEERQVPYITSVEEIGFERGMQQGRQEGHQEGRQEEARSLILRQLHRRLGELPEASRGQIEGLSVAQLEALGEALLDFTHLSHLEAWLAGQER